MTSLEHVNTDEVLDILLIALSCLLLHDAVNRLSDTHPNTARIFPYLRCHASKTSFAKANETDESVHFRRLANVLESFQLDMVNIAPDGDFLFSSVATHIEHLLSPTASTSDLVKAHLESIGIHSTMSRCSLIQHLRDLLVHEWLNNGSRYEPFFSGRVKNFEDEALQYQSPGMFSSELGVLCS